MASRATLNRRSSRRTIASRHDSARQVAKSYRKAGEVTVIVDPERAREIAARGKPPRITIFGQHY